MNLVWRPDVVRLGGHHVEIRRGDFGRRHLRERALEFDLAGGRDAREPAEGRGGLRRWPGGEEDSCQQGDADDAHGSTNESRRPRDRASPGEPG